VAGQRRDRWCDAGRLRHPGVARLRLARRLPPQYGIYCYLVGGLFYALFGSSRQLAIGPTSAISMLVGVTVAGMAQGDPGRWASIAALTAVVIAAMCVLAWLFRLSSLVNFISETILLGFKAGAALTIAMTQLPKLFGVKGGGHGFFESAVTLGSQLPDTNFAVLAFGLAALAVLLLGEKFLPGRPIALFVVVISIIVLSVTPLGTSVSRSSARCRRACPTSSCRTCGCAMWTG
jgi:SulP family sulfate permease